MFKQLFDDESSTYTYVIVGVASQEALIIYPVASHIDAYI